jgi:hypothetical protein
MYLPPSPEGLRLTPVRIGQLHVMFDHRRSDGIPTVAALDRGPPVPLERFPELLVGANVPHGTRESRRLVADQNVLPSTVSSPSHPTLVLTTALPIAQASRILMRVPPPERIGTT